MLPCTFSILLYIQYTAVAIMGPKKWVFGHFEKYFFSFPCSIKPSNGHISQLLRSKNHVEQHWRFSLNSPMNLENITDIYLLPILFQVMQTKEYQNVFQVFGMFRKEDSCIFNHKSMNLGIIIEKNGRSTQCRTFLVHRINPGGSTSKAEKFSKNILWLCRPNLFFIFPGFNSA